MVFTPFYESHASEISKRNYLEITFSLCSVKDLFKYLPMCLEHFLVHCEAPHPMLCAFLMCCEFELVLELLDEGRKVNAWLMNAPAICLTFHASI
jgi:hypothetical protein